MRGRSQDRPLFLVEAKAGIVRCAYCKVAQLMPQAP